VTSIAMGGLRHAMQWRTRLFGLLMRGLLVAVTALVLPLLAILGALIALAIVLDSPGPVLYRSRRIGLNGEPFDMLKFRKMRVDAAGPALTTIDDERFTPVGRFLAITRLDELPQIWNVLRGEMRLVGPRPEVEPFVRIYPEQYEVITKVLPGITGLAQIRFSNESRVLAQVDAEEVIDHYRSELLPAKIEIDRFYIANRCASLDLRILATTALLPVRNLYRAARARSGVVSMPSFAAAALLLLMVATFSVQAAA
jgi:lipopolysaccharide/colanic/teichoic acid biosynthesis glycosyltransferase